MHFDGPNGSTSFVDSAGLFVQSTNVGCSISTAQSKFGGSSLSVPVSGNYMVGILPQGALDYGSGDFTLEFWVYAINFGSVNTNYPYVVALQSALSQVGLQFFSNSGGTTVQAQIAINGSYQNTATVSLPANAWAHVALVRYLGNFTFYLNGAVVGAISSPGSIFPLGNTATLQFGGFNPTGSAFVGYVDELRLSAIAQYTAAFTPPTSAFPNPSYTNTSIVSFNANSGAQLPYRWKSKQFYLPWPTAYMFCRVTADSYASTTLNLFADGTQYGGNIPVTGQNEFILPQPPGGACVRYFEFSLSGTDKINRVQFAEDIEDLM